MQKDLWQGNFVREVIFQFFDSFLCKIFPKNIRMVLNFQQFVLFILLLCHPTFMYAEIEVKKYKVSGKDTFYSIAKKFKIDLSSLIEFNKKKNAEHLKEGEILKIPSRKTENITLHFPLLKKAKVEKKYSGLAQFPFKGILFSRGKSNDVLSVKEGIVQVCDYMDGYENYVIISHTKGFYSLYGNLSEVYVAEGQKVESSEKIGKLALTKGLYFQINHQKKSIDPENFLN